ncbi:hypothetical protein, partial [Bordetella sp. 15P40C-2]|uniref:hypothetical protein n=1 Tax=Bordetella sp. 15P40C-2 TaxID=2572246 RepID=UPI001F2F0CC4
MRDNLLVGWLGVNTSATAGRHDGYDVRLYIINGGRPAFIRLVFAKNLSKGNNADVPNRFY